MNAKRKGNCGEREVLRLLEERGVLCQRNQQGLLAGFASGEGNPDLLIRIGGRELHGEIKRCERLRLNEAIRQAEHDACGRVPVVIHRASRQPWYMTLRLSDFLDLTLQQGDSNEAAIYQQDIPGKNANED